MLSEFSLTQMFWKFLVWNYLQSLFHRNKRMAFLIFFEEHQSILVCLLFSSLPLFFAPRGSPNWLPFPPFAVQLKQPLAVTWHSCVMLTWIPTRGPPGRLRDAGKIKPLVKYCTKFTWVLPTCYHGCKSLKWVQFAEHCKCALRMV